MKKNLLNILYVFLLLSIFISSCKKDENVIVNPEVLGQKTAEFDSKMVNVWFTHTLELIPNTKGYTPPVVARNLGYISIGLYETLLPGMPTNKSLAGQLNGLGSLPTPLYGQEYYLPAAANAALARMHEKFFPLPEAKQSKYDSIQTIKNAFLGEFQKAGVRQEVLDRSIAFGEKMADAIFVWSSTDVIGHEAFRKNFPAAYAVPTGAGFWEPTNAQKIPLQPFWGTARCFIPKSASDAQPSAPPAFSKDKTSQFYAAADVVFNTIKNIKPEQKATAFYWADGGGTMTPAGHSFAITKQMVQEKNLKLDQAATLYAKMGIVLSDAFMACWKCKYKYNLMRPVTYIQQNIDPSWKPLFDTPPFPEYVSGHSSQSGAAGYILSQEFGLNTSFVDKTHEKRKDIDGKPRAYDTFMKMAEEAAVSRLYGGIHYEFGNNNGLISGMKIGKALDKIQFKK